MKTLEELLGEHPFFQGMDKSHLGLIADCASNVVFEESEQIFKEGDTADFFYIVRQGRVSLEAVVPRRGPVNILSVVQ